MRPKQDSRTAKCTFVGMLLLFARLTTAARNPNDKNCVCKKSNKAIESANNGKMEEAELLFLECAIECSGNSDNWENLAVALMRSGNYNRAGLGRPGGSALAYDSAAAALRTALRLAKRDGRTKDIESIQFHKNLVEENRRHMNNAASELPEGDIVSAALAEVDAKVNIAYEKLKDDLIKFYRVHAPNKLNLVDRLVEHYGESKKKTMQLWARLHSKYSNSPKLQDLTPAPDKDQHDARDKTHAHSQDKHRVHTQRQDKRVSQNKNGGSPGSRGKASPAVFSHISVRQPAPSGHYDASSPLPQDANFGAGDIIHDLRERLERMRMRAEGAEAELEDARRRIADQEALLSAQSGQCEASSNHEQDMVEYFASLKPSQVENVGSIFCHLRYHERELLQDVNAGDSVAQEVVNMYRNRDDNTAEDVPYPRLQATNSKASVDMLSVPLTQKEKEYGMNGGSIIRLQERVDRWGVANLPSIIPEQEIGLLKEMSDFVEKELLSPTAPFSAVYQNSIGHRYDYPLPLTGIASEFFRRVLKVVGPALTHILGPDAALVEFAAMASYAGAPEQTSHSDTGHVNPRDAGHRALLYSCFVYLDDVSYLQGALDVWPGSNKYWQLMPRRIESLWAWLPAVRMVVPKGSIVILDSRTLHRGTAHTAEHKRPRLAVYFTFCSQKGSAPLGSTWTLRSQYDDTIDLKTAMTHASAVDVRSNRGRFCFGALNSAQLENMLSHYPDNGMCTKFKYDTGYRHTVEAMYYAGKEEAYMAIWVNGSLVVSEPRDFVFEPGPAVISSACTGKKERGFTGGIHRVTVYQTHAKTALSLSQISQLTKKRRKSLSGPGKRGRVVVDFRENIRNILGEIRDVERYPVVWVRAEVTPSAADKGKLHAIVTFGGDGSRNTKRWNVKCVGIPIALSWGQSRQAATSLSDKRNMKIRRAVTEDINLALSQREIQVQQIEDAALEEELYELI